MSTNTEKNRSHWDENASTYNSRFQKTIQQIIEEIQARKDWIGVDWADDNSLDDDDDSGPATPTGKPVRLLDYACGTGLVSRALAPYVTQCVGIDLSEGMVSEYNRAVSNQGISESEMHAVVGNLIAPAPSESLSGEEFYGFDLAVVGLGFHHFDNPGLAAKRLAERLKKGGVLMIIDFLPHGPHAHGHSHGHDHRHGHHQSHDHKSEEDIDAGNDSHYSQKALETVTHYGFSEADVKRMFDDAGVGEGFEYVTIGKGIVLSKVLENGEDLKRSVFMARGYKY